MITDSTLPLKFWYAASIGCLGAFPFVAVILSDNGWTPTGIAALMAIFPICSMLTAPLWSLIADMTGKGITILRFATILQLLGFSLLFALIDSPIVVATSIVLLATGRAPMSPLSDAMTLAVLGSDSDNYGSVRTWGSVAFLVVALMSGYLRLKYPNSPLLLGASVTILTVVLAWRLPVAETAKQPAPLAALKHLIRRPLLPFLLVLATLHGITLTTYDNLFSLHVEGLGYSSTLIGYGVGLGVVVEIVVLGLGKRILNTFSPLSLMLFGVASGVPRWWITAVAQSETILVLAQGLHGVGFGAFWVGGVALFARIAPKNFERSSQAILPTTTWGIGCVAAMALASTMLKHIDSRQLFQLMALVSLLTSFGMAYIWTQKQRLLAEQR